jgi:tight adherence protein C
MIVFLALQGWLQPVIISFVVSTIVATVAFSIYSFAFPETTASDRLHNLTLASDSNSDILSGTDAAAVEALAARLGRMAQAGGDDDSTEKLRKTLLYAGHRNRRSLEVFNGVRIASMMLVPVAVSPLGFVVDVSVAAFGMLLGAATGYYMPLFIITSQAQTRQASILRAYPDALDLMVSSVESGLSLDQAFRRVADEMKAVSPVLSREFSLVNSQVSAGIDRITALKRLEERTGLDELRSFVNMLAQAERFGSSISDSMRLYSSVAREKRMARAEEKAGQVGSKLTVIMIVFFLPVLMFVLLTPSAIRIIYGEE